MSALRKVSTGPRSAGSSEATPSLPSEMTHGLAAQAVRVVTRAEAMGLIPTATGEELSTSMLVEALRALGAAGIGRELFMTRGVVDERSLTRLNQMIEASPHPPSEWDSVSSAMGPELAAGLLGISSSSIRRYASGMRPTPDVVASRLHFLAMVLADLKGSYSEYGVRRWFSRPRGALGGRRPLDVLSGSWAAEDREVRIVAELAASLVGVGPQ